MSEDENPKDIVEFLKKDGGLGLILLIDKEQGNVVKELTDKLPISKNTVSERLREARSDKYDLINLVNPLENQRSDRYMLTTRGEDLRELLERFDLVEAYKSYVTLYAIINNAPEQLSENIEMMGLTNPEYESVNIGDVHADSSGEIPDDSDLPSDIREQTEDAVDASWESGDTEAWGEPDEDTV